MAPEPDDRMTFAGDRHHMDELVIENATVHIERSSQHNWWISVDRDGKTFHAYFADLLINENTFTDLQTVEAPLLGCDVEWGYLPKRHRCERMGTGHRKHRCECGETR